MSIVLTPPVQPVTNYLHARNLCRTASDGNIHTVIFQSILLLVVSQADHDEQLPQTNDCIVSPPLPTILQGYSLALN